MECIPSVVLADKTYRNRDNLRYCKEKVIRLSGPRLGRPKLADQEEERKQAYQDNCDRNMVEGRYGLGKRRYGLDLIMATLAVTAETEAALNILAMNIGYLIRVILRLLFGWFKRGLLTGDLTINGKRFAYN